MIYSSKMCLCLCTSRRLPSVDKKCRSNKFFSVVISFKNAAVVRVVRIIKSYPVHCAKVDSFSKVKTLVESTVISSGESDDKLACALVGTVDLAIQDKKRRRFATPTDCSHKGTTSIEKIKQSIK